MAWIKQSTESQSYPGHNLTRWRLKPYLLMIFCMLLINVVINLMRSVPLTTPLSLGCPIQSPIRKEFRKTAEGTSHEYLKIFNASVENNTEKDSINSNKCVPLKTTLGYTPICVYDPSIDRIVSGLIVKAGVWEPNIVFTVASFLKENPDMQLLDIGCNIGVFTLQAAKMGHKVIAIDANKFNLRLLSKSLRLGGLQSNVTLLWNAVSDVHETIKLTITTGNIGKSFVKPERDLDPTSNRNFDKQTALAITLEDLISFFSGVPLFIKMDIEGSEWRALRGGERFFQEVNVRYILMEWVFYRNTENALDIVGYFTSFGFQPYAVHKNLRRPLASETSERWPRNVLWVKT